MGLHPTNPSLNEEAGIAWERRRLRNATLNNAVLRPAGRGEVSDPSCRVYRQAGNAAAIARMAGLLLSLLFALTLRRRRGSRGAY